MKKNSTPTVADSGTLGGADYTVYDVWNTIHIQNKGNPAIFKKDLDAFNDILEGANWENMKEGDSFSIPGSGTNPTLHVSILNGDLCLTVEQVYKFPALNKFFDVIMSAKKRKAKKV